MKISKKKLIPKHLLKSPIYRKPTPWELDRAKEGSIVFVTNDGQRLSYVPEGYSIIDGSEKKSDVKKDGSDQYQGKVLDEITVSAPYLSAEDKEKLQLAALNIQNQGEITPLTEDEAEERMGFWVNLRDTLGVTNARNDSNRSLMARMADQMLWNLDSRNPRSNETRGAIYSAIGLPIGKAVQTTEGLGTMINGLLVGEAINNSPRLIRQGSFGEMLGKLPIMTNESGNLLTTLIGSSTVAHPYFTNANKVSGWANEGLFKFLTEPKTIVRRGMELAMRTGFGANPIVRLKDGIRYSLKNRNVGEARMNYLISGDYDGNAPSWAKHWKIGTVKTEPYRGMFPLFNGKEPTIIEGPDIIDAYVYGKVLDPKIATRVDHSHGIHTNYIKKKYPDRDVPVYEMTTDNPIAVSKDIQNPDEITWISDGRIEGANAGVDAGGHAELRHTEDGTTYRAYLDIWKFNPEEYSKRWLSYLDKEPWYTRFMLKSGLNLVDKLGHPLIIKTKWTPITRHKPN